MIPSVKFQIMGIFYPFFLPINPVLNFFLNTIEWMPTGFGKKAESVQYIMLCFLRYE